MTELEKIARAKMYMESLAEGTNPIDGGVIPEGEIINNVKLSRCFFYVADLLDQIIEAGGIQKVPSKKQKKLTLSLTQDQISNFRFSRVPITASEISKRIEELIDTDTMKGLSANKILSWFEYSDAITPYVNAKGKKQRSVSATGRNLGLDCETRISMNGNEYYVILFNRQAQELILDNTDAILEYAETLKEEKKANSGAPWSAEHDAALVDMFQKDYGIEGIAEALQRSRGGIVSRLRKLGFDVSN